MTEFLERATETRDKDRMDFVDSSDSEDSNPKSDSSTSTSTSTSTSSSGSWSIDDSIEFMQTSHKPMFDELPTFSLRSTSPQGRSLSPMANEPISLFNLSISPISSIEDLSNDQSVCASSYITNGKYTKDLTQSLSSNTSYEEDERISLEEITAHINTPPSALSRSNKRLNLETIFEDVFLETPKKRRFNGFKRFNSWRIETFQEITNEERINSYVFEQQQNYNEQDARSDTTKLLCTAFDDKINLN